MPSSNSLCKIHPALVSAILALLASVAGCDGESTSSDGDADCAIDTCDDAAELLETRSDDVADVETEVHEPDLDTLELAHDLDPIQDTEDLPDVTPIPLAAQGEWGPSSRVTHLNVPETAGIARSSGCLIFGRHVGSSISNLLLLSGGVDQYLVPNGTGEIALVMLVQAQGWQEGQAVEDVGVIALNFFEGVVSDLETDTFSISPTSYLGNDPMGELKNRFPETEPQQPGWFQSRPTPTYLFKTPLLEGFFLDVPLNISTFQGRLFVDGPGFGISDGVLTGYMTEESLLQLALDLRDTCAGMEPPAVCDLIGGQIQPDDPPEDIVALLLTFTSGYDIRMEDGFPYECDPEQEMGCNAMSICLLFESEGVVVDGLAP